MTFGLIAIAIVFVLTILVSLGLVKEKHYPLCLTIMAAGLVYSITLLGTYVVGSDIQGELAASRAVLANGWNFTDANDVNAITGINMTSVVTGFLAPALSTVLHLDLIWVYKAVLPLFLIAVPPVVFKAFETQVGSKRAFLATLFFIVMPVYSLQLAQIAKSMVGELFFALMILVLVNGWRTVNKAVEITLCLIGAAVSHYTIGIAMLMYLLGIVVVRLITTRMTVWWRLWEDRRTSVAALVIALVIGSAGFFTYYQFAHSGTVNTVLSNIAGWYVVNPATEAIAPPPQIPVPTEIQPAFPTATPKPIIAVPEYLYKQEYTVQVGLGLDFFDQPIEGKLFRVLQYLTQLLIVIGAFRLLLKHEMYRFSAEFVAGIGCSFGLLGICMFVPYFSSIINMPRFYQISLFFLAPMLVLGCDAIATIPSLIRTQK